MSQFILLAASGGIGDIARSTGEQFGFNTQLFISQVISFCIVAFLLHRFAYKPILKVLEERRQKIAESLANAEKIKQELASAQIKSQELLNQASVQANKIIEEARAAAARITETETQKAVAAAQDIIQKARQANEAELARLRAELRREIGQLAVKAAMQVTGKILTAEDQRRLAEETNQQLAA
jgi:F-type H+-transporting ATPase subunit b